MVRRRQAVTIRHVAADAGVSLQTVSRVINKEAGVSPDMQKRVQGSIEKLGYVPSIAAQRMSGSRSYLILVLNDRERTLDGFLARDGNDWLGQLMFGGMSACYRHGYRLMIELIDTRGDHIKRELLAAIAALRPDGAILTPPHSQNPLISEILHQHGIRVARIGTETDGPGICLNLSDADAARQATQHLIDLGHARIGFISGAPDYELSHWRIKGWQTAMHQNALSTQGLLADGDFTYASGRAAALQLLDTSRPTALIASNDQMALACLDLARERGLSVPEQLSLISFDDTPVIRHVTPPITAVMQPIAEVTSRAVDWLIEGYMDTPGPSAGGDVPAQLLIRASTALAQT